MSEAEAPAADWYPDPSGRFQFRYWDGETWTGHVSTDGKTDWDPPADGAAADDDAGAAAAGGAEDDHVWAPTEDPAAADVPVDEQAAAQQDDVHAAALPDGDVGSASAEPATGSAGEMPRGDAIAEDEPNDTNLVANRRAGVAGDVQAWMDEVAAQVEPRLSRIHREWTSQPQAEAARACAYGLLIGHLARMHPHMRAELGSIAEAHPSFSTLESGSRLETLEGIAGDPQRAASWLGPLIGTDDPERLKTLFD